MLSDLIEIESSILDCCQGIYTSNNSSCYLQDGVIDRSLSHEDSVALGLSFFF